MTYYRQAKKGDDHLAPVKVWVIPITIDYKAAEIMRQLGGTVEEIFDAALGDADQ